MNKREDPVYFLKNWRPSSVGAENAKSARLMTIPKKKFVLRKRERERIDNSIESIPPEKCSGKKQIFTEHNRVISWQYELDDGPDAPKCELHHRAFYPSQFEYQHWPRHSDRVHEPWKKKN